MSLDPAFIRAAHRLKLRTLRPDGASDWASPTLQANGCPADHGGAGPCFS